MTLNSHVKTLFFNGKDDEPIRFPQDLSIVEIPLEGMAAYWLSIRKTLQNKKGMKFIEGEIEHLREPYIRHLLEIGFSSFDQDQIRRFAGIKKETIVSDLRRKLILMSIGLLGMTTNENPQQVLIRILSKFPISPVLEKEVFAKAQEILQQCGRPDTAAQDIFDVNYSMDVQELITGLVFYCMLGRRKDREAWRPLMGFIKASYFVEGLTLIMDGFDYDFIKHRLNNQKNEILQETTTKMDMAMEMCIAIRQGMAYEDIFRIAKSFML